MPATRGCRADSPTSERVPALWQARRLERRDGLFSGANAVKKRLFEQRDARQIGVRKMHRPKGLHRALSRAAKQKAGARLDHAVTPAVDIDALDVGLEPSVGGP